MWSRKGPNWTIKRQFKDINPLNLDDFETLSNIKMTEKKTALVTGPVGVLKHCWAELKNNGFDVINSLHQNPAQKA